MISMRSDKGSCRKKSVGLVLAVSVLMLLLIFAPSTRTLSENYSNSVRIQSYSLSNNSTVPTELLPVTVLNNTETQDNAQSSIPAINSTDSSMTQTRVQSTPPANTWAFIFLMSNSGGEDLHWELFEEVYTLFIESSDASVKLLALIDWEDAGDDVAKYFDYEGHHQIIPLTDINPTWTNGEINSADPNTLASWGKYCVDSYPASNYVIILWDHGAGIDGCNHDDLTDDLLTPRELGSALSQIKSRIVYDYGTSSKISLVGFDCCHEALVEIADEIRDYAPVMVASEMSNWVRVAESTWCFGELVHNLKQYPSMTPLQLGADIVTRYITRMAGHDYSCTLSAIDLTKVPTLMSGYLNPLTTDIFNKWSNTLRSQIKTAISQTQGYLSDSNLDLGDFAYKLYQQVSDSTIRNDALNLYYYLATGQGVIYANGHYTGHSTADLPDSNRPTDRACGLALNFYSSSNPYPLQAPWLYKNQRILDQTNIQNDTYLDKVECAYYGLSTWPLLENFTVGGTPDGNLPSTDWQITKSGNNDVILDDTIWKIQSPSMKIIKSATQAHVYAQHYFIQTAKIVVQADLMFASTNGATCYFMVNDVNINSNILTAFVWSGSTWSYAYYDSSYHNVKTVNPNTWYRITLDINNAIGKFDIYVNGDLVKSGAAFRTGSPYPVDLCNVYFQAGWADSTTATMWVDDLCVRSGGSSTPDLLLIDHFNNFDAPLYGGWTRYGVPTYGTISKDTTLGYGYTSDPCAKLYKSKTIPGYVYMLHTFSPRSNHIIAEAALKVLSSASDGYTLFCLNSGSTNAVVFAMAGGASGGLFYWVSYSSQGDVYHSIGMSYVASRYYLVTLDIDITGHTYGIYIDGCLIYNGAGWYVSASSLDGIVFASKTLGTQKQITWVDDVIVTN